MPEKTRSVGLCPSHTAHYSSVLLLLITKPFYFPPQYEDETDPSGLAYIMCKNIYTGFTSYTLSSVTVSGQYKYRTSPFFDF